MSTTDLEAGVRSTDWPALAFEHRKADFNLDDDALALAQTLDALFQRQGLPTSVRRLDTGTQDDDLLGRLADLGVLGMGLPAGAGGDDASLTVLVAVAERLGAWLAPVPLLEYVVGSRLLAALPGAPSDVLDDVPTGKRTVTPALKDLRERQLLPAGATATHVIGRRGQMLVLHEIEGSLPAVPNHGDQPLAVWDPEAARPEVVLAEGETAITAFATARRERMVLSAAALAGLADRVLREAVEFAKVRQTRGIAIGALQAVSHRLADDHIVALAARNLARKAAWFETHEPGERPELPLLAHVSASRAASRCAHTSVHVHGGQGVSLESDITLFFTRSKAWGLTAGDLSRLMPDLGRSLVAAHDTRKQD